MAWQVTGGLYVPALFPERCLTYDMVAEKSYEDIAYTVFKKSFSQLLMKRNYVPWLRRLTAKQISVRLKLHRCILILERLSVLELFHGRTQAFKDMALSLFPYLLVAAKEAEKETDEVLILTATSGDTGKAALEGFKDVPGTHIQVF